MLIFDYSKLKGKIKEIFNTQEIFAKEMGISETTISERLNNKSQWIQQEITKACELLGIREDEVNIYFFCRKS